MADSDEIVSIIKAAFKIMEGNKLDYIIKMAGSIFVGGLLLTGVWWLSDFAWQNVLFLGGAVLAVLSIGGTASPAFNQTIVQTRDASAAEGMKKDYPAALNPYFIGLMLLTLSVIPLDFLLG
jgi:hypothetical protein